MFLQHRLISRSVLSGKGVSKENVTENNTSLTSSHLLCRLDRVLIQPSTAGESLGFGCFDRNAHQDTVVSAHVPVRTKPFMRRCRYSVAVGEE